MLTQDQITEAVQDALPSVLAGLKKQIQEQALYSAQNTMVTEVNKAVTQWIVDNLVPEIHSTLAQSKDGLIAMVPKIAEGITDALAKSMNEAISKKLENSWERKKIFEALIS
jgi:hypothetical protein